MNTIITDILIIGGGVAGLIAAIHSKDENNSVTIVCKSKAGKSGNTIVSGSALCVMNRENEYCDTLDTFKDDVLKSGAGINNKDLVEIFVNNSLDALRILAENGVKFREVDGKQLVKRPPGHSVPRSYPTDFRKYSYMTRGLALSLPLLESAEKKGIDIINDCTIIKIAVVNGTVRGALGINNITGEMILFKTNIIILAAGGGGNIFLLNNNTNDMTCDSYSLAYDAGAVLMDMELVQFYPTMMYDPIKVPISNPLFGDGAILKNKYLEEFMSKYSDDANFATRDMMAIAIKKEINEGNGNPNYIYVDCSKINGETIDKKYAELSNILNSKNIDIKKDLLPVAPGAHFYLGGVKIDSECKTSIEGLLSCGEAATGVHGANRLSGNAIAEAVIFGKIAGETAKNLVNKIDNFDYDIDNPALELKEGKFDIVDLIKQLQDIMWNNASLIRCENSLNNAKCEIKTIEDKLNFAQIKGTKDILNYYKIKSLINVSKMLIEGAMLRKESRGAHYRSDYPEKDDNLYKGNFYYKKDSFGVLNITYKSSN